jgi:LytS/YehU family sensor histidine kinase
MLAYPWVKLDILIENEKLEFKISNNKPEWKNEIISKNGIGLYNVKKRLQLLYPGAYSLNITENEMSYNVVLTISIHPLLQQAKQVLNRQENKIYELV